MGTKNERRRHEGKRMIDTALSREVNSMSLLREEQLEEGITKVCNALLDGYMERDFDSITCVCIECNECPFNDINNLKKWMDKYIKEKIESIEWG